MRPAGHIRFQKIKNSQFENLNDAYIMCGSRKYPYPPPPPPRKGMEIPEGGGCHRPRNFRKVGGGGEGGRGCCFDEFFFQAGLNFLTVVRNVSLFALSFSSHERRKNKSR